MVPRVGDKFEPNPKRFSQQIQIAGFSGRLNSCIVAPRASSPIHLPVSRPNITRSKNVGALIRRQTRFSLRKKSAKSSDKVDKKLMSVFPRGVNHTRERDMMRMGIVG